MEQMRTYKTWAIDTTNPAMYRVLAFELRQYVQSGVIERYAEKREDLPPPKWSWRGPTAAKPNRYERAMDVPTARRLVHEAERMEALADEMERT